MVDNKNIMYRNITNQRVVDYMDSFYKPISDELGKLRIESEENFVPVLQRDSERLLSTLLQIHQPKTIVEIGTAVGYSGLCMLTVAKDAELYTFEIQEKMIIKAKENFESFGVSDRVHLFEGDAMEKLKELDKNLQIDFAFIDAAKGHYRDFFDEIIPHMKKGGVIVCDNMLFRAKVVSDDYDRPRRRFRTEVKRIRNFMKFLFETDLVDTTLLSVGDGTTISIVK